MKHQSNSTQSIFKLGIYFLVFFVFGCNPGPNQSEDLEQASSEEKPYQLIVETETLHAVSGPSRVEISEDKGTVSLGQGEWIGLDANFEQAGRYRVEILASGQSDDGAVVWIEDYYDNKDQRTYDVTGKIKIEPSEDIKTYFVEGSPFNKGLHKIKLHVDKGSVVIDKITFSLMKEHSSSPISLTQNMDGQEWELVWSDEFEGDSIDESKWTFDFGNWGWGNNELQYYTDNRSENARIEDGILVIEARKNDMGQDWTSTRMTTRGKVSFLYGKIEFRAKVPREKGNWAAGWTLGDDYVDEKSWPYSGEIDIMESVGYEVDNETGDGIAHSTVHTPAYYFKINNQISSTIDVKNIAGEFHTYAVEWTPTEIRGYVNGEQYYVYDKTANELEWPFNKPQNIILNLAMGGGWGGAQGMDESVTSQKLLIDYVRVYGKK